MILVIDNYDSFTFNLVQYLGEVSRSETEIHVKRNDAISVTEIRALRPAHIVISPGPCSPNEAGISLDIISELSPEFPILGVCLGHQCIGQAFGGKVIRAATPIHGKVWRVEHRGHPLFSKCENPFPATRYHSLVVERESLPECLEVIAWTEEGEIMALSHREHSHVLGVQFHPESIMTQCGKQLLANFLTFSAPSFV